MKGTGLANPDFKAMAVAFGARGLVVNEPGEVDPIIREALATPGPVLVEVRTSLEHLSAC